MISAPLSSLNKSSVINDWFFVQAWTGQIHILGTGKTSQERGQICGIAQKDFVPNRRKVDRYVKTCSVISLPRFTN